MAVPAAPAAPQRDAVKAWQDAYRVLQHDAERWGQRLAAGSDPLNAGERQRLASLITQVESMFNVGPKEAQIAAKMWDEGMTAARSSLAAAMAELPQHAVASAKEVATELGWKRIPNETAVRAVVNNEIGQLTSDYVRLTEFQQQRLATDLANAVGQGMAPRDLAKNVSLVVEEWFRTGQARSVMIARTNMARAYDLSSLSVYKDAASRGLIKGWKWVAHGKDPCPVCQTLHGMVFEAESDTYRHPNCTCTNIPVLMDAKGKPGERVNPRPGTNFDDLELYTSESGWTSWRMKPKNPTGKAKGKVTADVVDGKLVAPKPVKKAAKPKKTPEKAPEPVPEAPKTVDVPAKQQPKHDVDYWLEDDFARSREITREHMASFSDRKYSDEYGYEYVVPDDKMMAEILKDQGFDVTPTVVNKETFAELQDAGLQPIARGITGDSAEQVGEFVDAFKYGENFAGRGVFGSGTYASSNMEVVEWYAKNTVVGREQPAGAVVKMLVKPDAKVIEWDDARRLGKELEDQIGEDTGFGYMARNRLRNKIDDEHEEDPIYLLWDPGRVAAMRGYDAIRIKDPVINGVTYEGNDYWVILNRGALIVEE